MAAKYPSIPDPTIDPASLRDSVLALKQAFEIMSGQRGDPSSAAVLPGDLSDTKSSIETINNSLGGFLPKSGGAMTGLLTGATLPLAMAYDSGATQGSFTARSSGVGDANLAGMTFLNDAYGMKMGVRADGTFGWGGWSRSTWSFYQNHSGDVVMAGNWTAFSDPRLKTAVSRIGGALGMIEKLDGVRFTWNDRSSFIAKVGERDIGVLADQVKAVLPEIVLRSIEDAEGNTYDTVAYEKLVPVLIEAIKELAKLVKR
ncbi:tail fiber domain-containing protein [Bradyrhizobium cenepequi]